MAIFQQLPARMHVERIVQQVKTVTYKIVPLVPFHQVVVKDRDPFSDPFKLQTRRARQVCSWRSRQCTPNREYRLRS